MKKIFSTLFLLLIIICFTACRKALKDVHDYYPKVTLVSAVIQENGMVYLEGKIDSKGNAPVEYFGFCYGINKIPELTDNQIFLSGNDSFFATVGPMNVDSVYYFRAWAANSYGYSLSEIIQMDSIIANPVTPPCILDTNYVKVNGGSISKYNYLNVIENTLSRFEFETYSNYGVAIFSFGSAISTGTYTTTANSTNSKGEVYISFNSGTMPLSIASGSKVYVNVIGHNKYDISICNAQCQYNGASDIFNSRCRVSY